MLRGSVKFDSVISQSSESVVSSGDPLPDLDVGGMVSSTVSFFPTYSVEVQKFPSNQAADVVVNAIGDLAHVFKAERSAYVKFKKQRDVCFVYVTYLLTKAYDLVISFS